MKKLFSLLFSVTFGLAHAQNWGEKIDFDAPTKYEVYAKSYSYSDTSFLITDLRTDSLYDPIESFNIKNLIVYRPRDGSGFLSTRPVIFFVHGGGWTDGYAFWYSFMSQSLTAEKGWILVIVDYRLTSDSVFIADEYCPDKAHCDETHRTKAAWYPDNINDVAEAFNWTYHSIDSLGGDTNNIFIFGHSAGGHLVSLLATHPAYAGMRSHIRGTISLSGAYQLKTLDMFLFAEVLDETFHGGHENNDAELDEASPYTYITGGLSLPLFQLLHCSMDIPSLPQQKILFTNQLNYYNYYNDNVYLDGFSHLSEITAFDDIDSEPVQQVVQFVQGHLYPTGIEEKPASGNSTMLQVRPNPATQQTTVDYTLAQPSGVTIALRDIAGTFYKKCFSGDKSAGEHQLKIALDGLKPGTYTVLFSTENITLTKKIIVY